ncbi:hypothetical protein, partial [Aminicella lysinilytica]|uniref:hypothetical protein n=1 Tax=Aminicella lysinilytica TaxID=433323 RepID=UPI001A9B8B0C
TVSAPSDRKGSEGATGKGPPGGTLLISTRHQSPPYGGFVISTTFCRIGLYRSGYFIAADAADFND